MSENDWKSEIATTDFNKNRKAFYPLPGVRVEVSSPSSWRCVNPPIRLNVYNTENFGTEKPAWVIWGKEEWLEKLIGKIEQKAAEAAKSVIERNEKYELANQKEAARKNNLKKFVEILENHPKRQCSWLKAENVNSLHPSDIIESNFEIRFILSGLTVEQKIQVWEEVDNFITELKNRLTSVENGV